jgi:hypothetical protein
MGSKGSIVLGLVAWAAFAPRSHGQTNDEFYRSWRWTEEVAAPRTAGLGGAGVALADDSAAAQLNPAGLTQLPKPEIAGGVLWRGPGSLGQDSTLPRAGIGFLGAGGLLTRKWALGGYVTEPFDERVVLRPGSTSGRLATTITAGGVALAWAPVARVRVGLRVNLAHLKVEGEWARGESASTSLRVGAATGMTRVTADAGVLLNVTDTLRLGATYRQGISWEVSRTAANPALGVAVDPGSLYRYRSPSIASAGASLRVGLRVVVSAQVDYLRLSEVQDAFTARIGPFRAADYELGDALEGRGGVELSQPVGRFSIQVRAGVHRASGASLRYVGRDVGEALRFRGSERMNEWSGGASVVLAHGSRVDLALVSDPFRTVLTSAVALRF